MEILIDILIFLGFTGIDQQYEKPDNPDLLVRTSDCTIEESMFQVITLLEEKVHCVAEYYCHRSQNNWQN